MELKQKIDLLTIGVIHGKQHLTAMFGDFDETLNELDTESKEFLFGHLTGMMEILRQLLPDEEE